MSALKQTIRIIVDYLKRSGISETSIEWLGGDPMAMQPGWMIRAVDVVREICNLEGVSVSHYINSNLLGYSPKWASLIHREFNGVVCTSFDFPNLYRRIRGGGTKEYDQRWRTKYRQAKDNGLRLWTLSVPNEASLKMGAEAYFSFFVDELGLDGFQIQPPFPGGPRTAVKEGYPLNQEKFSLFLARLFDVWMQGGYNRGIVIKPFSWMVDYFINHDKSRVPCVWAPSCDHIVAIDPAGNVATCDCWVAGYPEYWYGNIHHCTDFDQIMNSKSRMLLRNRVAFLVRHHDCGTCDYLALCHGGCPVHAYSTFGTLAAKDPYCETYKAIFKHVQGFLATHRQLFRFNEGVPSMESGNRGA
jgi:uncharacterized protein